ncbi:hypothetical protein [Mycolicibacterium komossense]|uniref:Uncharacterized protein n=1 Tax=Mycolicibacterium komossense TaxID=1779 RepID=A0ABT3CFH9_9MYCO|nr:hypothetical protein [Mycolicibacterium komossense]MCV7228147.1 hypothetical protein [Mycolicibacterium komossense]
MPFNGIGSLALCDAVVFAHAVTLCVHQDDSSQLGNYSDTCLHHIWGEQIHAVWLITVMPEADDSRHTGEFRG